MHKNELWYSEWTWALLSPDLMNEKSELQFVEGDASCLSQSKATLMLGYLSAKVRCWWEAVKRTFLRITSGCVIDQFLAKALAISC